MARGPVGYTCPDIDASIEYVEAAIEAVKQVDNLSELLGKSGLLESLRKANDALREWGAEQEDLAEKLQAEVDSLENKLEIAEDKIGDLEAQLSSVETS